MSEEHIDITSVSPFETLFRQRDEAIAEREVLRRQLEAARAECARLRSKLIGAGITP